jgi:hypothetical protein
MRKLTFGMNLSLDGYIAAPGDDLGWSVPSDELFQWWSDRVGATGRLLFNVLAMVAEFESDLIRLRTREGMRSPRPRVGCVASSPSSTAAKKHTWSPWCTVASTAPPRSPSSSVSAAQRSTAPSNGNAWKREPASRTRPRSADTSSRHRLSRIRHPCGTPAPHHARMGQSALMRFVNRGHMRALRAHSEAAVTPHLSGAPSPRRPE